MRSDKKGKLLKTLIVTAAVCAVAVVGVLLFLHFTPVFLKAGAHTSGAVGSSAQNQITQALEDNIHDHEYILVWDETVPSEERVQLVNALGSFEVIEEFDDIYMVVRCEELTVSASLEALKGIKGVVAADPNYIMVTQSLENDTYGSALWALDNTGYYDYFDMSTGSAVTLPIHADIDINYPEAAELYGTLVTEPEPVVVAIIDTGVDINHPELADHIWVNEGEIPGDGIDNDGNGYIDDYYGWDFYNNDNTVIHYDTDYSGSYLDNDNHGTKVAGVIVATANNTAGIAGVASMAPVKIMVIKMNGGARSYGTVANAIKAVNYATSMGADVCNMSWGIQKSSITDTSATLESLKTAMSRSDMLFVCAAGNTGTNNDEFPVYPANFALSNNISVTWCDQYGKLVVPSETHTEGSCYGATTVDLAAPGVYIMSTTVGGGYVADSGSSLAAPYVSGIAAVLMSTGKNLYPSEIRDLIITTRKTVPNDGTDYTLEDSVNPFDEMSGKIKYPGIPDLYAALSSIEDLLPDTNAPEVNVTRSFEDDVILLSVSAKDILSGVRTIRYTLDANESDIKDAAYFRRGILGDPYTGVLRLAKGGIYSIYVSDYAGNETVVRYVLNDDVTAPSISFLTTTKSPSGKIIAVFDVEDVESGVAKFMLLAGDYTPVTFLENEASAAVLKPVDGRLLLHLSGPGTYTLYAVDGRGNEETYLLKVE